MEIAKAQRDKGIQTDDDCHKREGERVQPCRERQVRCAERKRDEQVNGPEQDRVLRRRPS